MTLESQKFFTLTFKVCSYNREVHFEAMYIIKILHVCWTYNSARKEVFKNLAFEKKKIQTIQYNETYFISRIAELDGKC